MGFIPSPGRTHMPWTAKLVQHNYWASALGPMSCNYWAPPQKLLKPLHLLPVRHKRSHCNEKPVHHNQRKAPTDSTYRRPTPSKEDPVQPKLNVSKTFFINTLEINVYRHEFLKFCLKVSYQWILNTNWEKEKRDTIISEKKFETLKKEIF